MYEKICVTFKVVLVITTITLCSLRVVWPCSLLGRLQIKIKLNQIKKLPGKLITGWKTKLGTWFKGSNIFFQPNDTIWKSYPNWNFLFNFWNIYHNQNLGKFFSSSSPFLSSPPWAVDDKNVIQLKVLLKENSHWFYTAFLTQVKFQFENGITPSFQCWFLVRGENPGNLG